MQEAQRMTYSATRKMNMHTLPCECSQKADELKLGFRKIVSSTACLWKRRGLTFAPSISCCKILILLSLSSFRFLAP